jgi:hypothetical protein
MEHSRLDQGSLAVASGAAAVAIILAAAMVPVRDSFGATNAALVLTLLVVLAAVLGGRFGGGVTGVVAALSFNFFFTRPYLTMRVDDGKDIATIVLIVAIGLIVGEVSVLRSRRVVQARDHVVALRGLEAVSARVAAGDTPAQLVELIHGELVDGLGLADARYEPVTVGKLPTLDRGGHLHVPQLVHAGRGFALPVGGVAIPVIVDGTSRGQLVVEGKPNVAVPLEQRRMMVAMAEQLAVSLRSAGRAEQSA